MFSEKLAGAEILISLRRENKESLFCGGVGIFSVLSSSKTMRRIILPSHV
jgi:hypothetical protein